MAAEPGAAQAGLFASIKSLAAGLLGIVQTRLELLAAEVAEERQRLTALLVLVLLSLFSLGLAVVLLSVLIVVALWESHRLAALGGLIGVFLIAGAGLGWLALHKLRSHPRLFDATITELAKDRQELNPGP